LPITILKKHAEITAPHKKLFKMNKNHSKMFGKFLLIRLFQTRRIGIIRTLAIPAANCFERKREDPYQLGSDQSHKGTKGKLEQDVRMQQKQKS
jgi:hypothetical protein